MSETETLTALRCLCLRGISHNFPKMVDGWLYNTLKYLPSHIPSCKIESQKLITFMYSDYTVKLANIVIIIKLSKKPQTLLGDQELQLQPTSTALWAPFRPRLIFMGRTARYVPGLHKKKNIYILGCSVILFDIQVNLVNLERKMYFTTSLI